ncbi:FAD-dependent monooxygenase [Natrinema soli]|uniref:FAD-dependent monooxygenase n=1 Tax=Natrinema soli TaxID=1930624 RepID=A0ABD5SKI6_9EURY|nr:FAD-dependent monooxygenase [Natrinema soli]
MTDNYEHYEAVVVGAGPGGAAAAATLADLDVETLVLERGVEAGSKNVSGGLIYAEESAPYTIDTIFPDFRAEATERPVTTNYIHNIAGETVKTYDLSELHHHDTEWADSVLRRNMDSWLETRVHEKTRETGGGLLIGVHATGLVRDGGEIVGVRTDELEPITADLIVAADGVNSELARDAGLMDWDAPDEWFQGVKAVVDMPEDEINERFGIDSDEGEAHLFSGDLYDGVRGGGFLYTNRDTLSIGNVFHLDSIVEEKVEVNDLLDALLTHPLLAQWLGDNYHELEYSAKLVPDSKKVAHRDPQQDRLVLVGDAAGQMQAQGPIIKGMNHAVTAGALAAEAFVEAKSRGDARSAGALYTRKLHDEGVMDKLRPTVYEVTSPITETDAVTGIANAVATSPVGRVGVRAFSGVLERLYNSPFVMKLMPDTNLGYVTVPTVIGEELGERVTDENTVEPPNLADRIGDLTYDVGEPHIEIRANSWEASGDAIRACPVSSMDYGGGCYRQETVESDDGEEQVVSLDTQPCVECGTCAIVADTEWTHPAGGKGVDFKYG